MNGWSLDELHRIPSDYVGVIAEMMQEEAYILEGGGDSDDGE
jgi:hypothetical protein